MGSEGDFVREIKFKAFIKHLKWMCEVESIDFINELVEVDLSAGQGDTSWYPFDEVELIQFSGIKDRYENEIYEGDILKVFVYTDEDEHVETGEEYKKPYLGIAKFEGGCFVLDVGLTSNNDCLYHYNEVGNFGECEIIGNLFEHPELEQQMYDELLAEVRGATG